MEDLMSKLTTVTVLAFERNLDILMVLWHKKTAKWWDCSAYSRKSIRGTTSNRV